MTYHPHIQEADAFERETLDLTRADAPGRPFVSRFGARNWPEIGSGARAYEWWVKGILPKRERVLVFGESQSGKSFETFNLTMCIARGIPFNGFRVERAAIVYCAFEGGKGFENRVVAYRAHHGLTAEDDVPFTLLTRRADLFGSDTDIEALLAEIGHFKGLHEAAGYRLGVVVLDTYSAATPGIKEISSEDTSRVLTRVQRIVDTVDATVIIVHHKPKGGDTPRGHGSLYGDLETAIDVRLDGEVKDGAGRPVRVATVVKQREGDQGTAWRFTLPKVEIGRDGDGDPITSCVVAPYERETADRRGKGFALSINEKRFFGAFVRAIEAHGVPTPHDSGAPANVLRVVDYDQVKQALWTSTLQEEDDSTQLRERTKKMLQRSRERLIDFRVVGQSPPWIWWTGTKVQGFAPLGLVGERYDRDPDADDNPY